MEKRKHGYCERAVLGLGTPAGTALAVVGLICLPKSSYCSYNMQVALERAASVTNIYVTPHARGVDARHTPGDFTKAQMTKMAVGFLACGLITLLAAERHHHNVGELGELAKERHDSLITLRIRSIRVTL